MDLRSYQKREIVDFRGLFDRGSRESIPLGHFADSQNLCFEPGRFKTRFGSSFAYNVTSGGVRNSVAQINTDGIITLFSFDDTGNIYYEQLNPFYASIFLTN